jgi:hypothetical protein
MLNKLFSLFKYTNTPKQCIETKVRITCKDFDGLTSLVNVEESDVTNNYVYLKCPLCLKQLQLPNVNIDKESNLHTEDHAVILESGELRPARL